MNYRAFSIKLKAQGFTKSEIVRLNRLGYESAVDAHKPFEKQIPCFHAYCAEIGRDFVIDNLDMFQELLKR